MSLIKNIMLLMVVLSTSSCVLTLSNDEYMELCPYERRYGGGDFYLEAPLVITPHQSVYQVGDTIRFNIEMDDEVMDLSRQMDFKITDFPIQPFFHLYRVEIENSVWQSGINLNELDVDSIYQPRLVPQSSAFATSVRGTTSYIDNTYKFEFDIILKVPGKYITHIIDKSRTVTFESEFHDGTYPEYLNVVNGSGCPEPNYAVCYTLAQDRHLDEYLDEFIFMDQKVYNNGICTLEDEKYPEFDGGQCFIPLEWFGYYAFEVME